MDNGAGPLGRNVGRAVLNGIGGLGTALAEVRVELPRTRFRRLGVPDKYVEIGPPAALYAHYRLDANGIAAVARELLSG